MLLTHKQMNDAIFARTYNPEHAPEPLTKGEEDRRRRGIEILKDHTLRFDYRSAVHTMADGTIPGENEGHSAKRCYAGYIGTMQAYDTAIFNHRRTK